MSSDTPSQARPKKRPGNRKPGRRESTLGQKTTAEANRRAAVILTVLAGERLPSEAAEVLGVSVTHYYILERKALEGLLAACQPQPKGPPGPTDEQRIAKLERELAQARRECQRQAALVRSTQRALGLPAAGPSAKKAQGKGKDKGVAGNGKSTGGGKKRRRRKPTVRALRAAETLEKNSSSSNSACGVKLKQCTPAASSSDESSGSAKPQEER